jgi:monothiol glutaredoxin
VGYPGRVYDRCASGQFADYRGIGIKEYSDWQTIPQLYIGSEFVGGTDILMSMHQDGSLSKLLEEKDVLVPADGE